MVLPLLLLYQVGLFFTDGRALSGADFVTGFILEHAGRRGLLSFNAVILLATPAAVWFLRRRGRFAPAIIVPVAIESIVYATILAVAMTQILARLETPRAALEAWMPMSSGRPGLLAGVCLALGAGVNEEVVFRLAIITPLVALGARAVGKTRALLLAMFASSTVFALAGGIGPEELTLAAFVCRFALGAAFCTIFAVRGLAVAVYTHSAVFLGIVLLAAPVTHAPATRSPGDPPGLLEARQGFQTRVTRVFDRERPMAEMTGRADISSVQFPAPTGYLNAFLSAPRRGSDGKSPVMIWLTGGFPAGGIDQSAWIDLPRANDQSAKQYRFAGVPMMYPSLRGSCGNPGTQEAFYGEVDDVLAAIDFVRRLDWVDPDRIYLGGHSTGGTLALLVAAATDRLHAVIAFGPVGDVSVYGQDVLPFDARDERELALRAPIRFLESIRCRTLIIEGDSGRVNNIDQLEALRRANHNPDISFFVAAGADHFTLLAPLNEVLAKQIARDEPLHLDD